MPCAPPQSPSPSPWRQGSRTHDRDRAASGEAPRPTETPRAIVGPSTPPSDARSPRCAGCVAGRGRKAAGRTSGDRSQSGPQRNRPPAYGRCNFARTCATSVMGAVAGVQCISRRSPVRRQSRISGVRHESAARPSVGSPRHCANQRPDVRRHGRSPDAATALPHPPQPQARSVPGDDGLGLDDHQRRAPSSPDAGANLVSCGTDRPLTL